MGHRNFDDPDAVGATAYANRVLLLNLVEAFEMRGVSGLARELANGSSGSIGKEPQSRVDAIFDLAEQIETISERVGRSARDGRMGSR